MHRISSCLLTLICLFALTAFSFAQEHHTRTIKAAPHGITVHCPIGWSLISWQKNDIACMMKIPQTKESSARKLSHGINSGSVTCRVAPAPESLKALQKRIKETQDDLLPDTDVLRALISSEIVPSIVNEKPDEDEKQLMVKWEYFDGTTWSAYEVEVFVIRRGNLYSFAITSDEDHFAAYQLDFEEMLKNLEFSRPNTRIVNQNGSYWYQPKFQYGIKAPEGWKALFPIHSGVSMSLGSEASDLYRETLEVRVSPKHDASIEELKQRFVAAYSRLKNTSIVEVELKSVLGQVIIDMQLETKDEAEGKITRLIRRVHGERNIYTIEISCRKTDFSKREAAFIRVLESFKEESQPALGSAT